MTLIKWFGVRLSWNAISSDDGVKIQIVQYIVKRMVIHVTREAEIEWNFQQFKSDSTFYPYTGS